MKIKVSDYFKSKVVFSNCLKYRYFLQRNFISKPENFLTFIMLNPSVADLNYNDPSVERCQRRALALGFDSFIVLNIFALISTNPKVLKKSINPVGQKNNFYLSKFKKNNTIICAWGNNGLVLNRGNEVLKFLKKKKIKTFCLGLTKLGQPKHPLYISYKQKLIIF